MGRYKLGPQGAYWDPNDSGPDQASPDQIQQLQQQQAPQGPSQAGGDPYQQGARPGYHFEWRGGFTGGKHEVPDNPNDPKTPPLTGKDILGGINPGPIGQPMPQPNIPGQPGWNGGFTGGMIPGVNLPPAIATDPTTGQMYDPATRSGSGTIGSPNYNDFYNSIYQRFLPQSQGFGAALSPLYQGASLGLAK